MKVKRSLLVQKYSVLKIDEVIKLCKCFFLSLLSILSMSRLTFIFT